VAPPFIAARAADPRPALLQRFLLFSNILPRDCKEIVGAGRQIRFARGQTIHLEGDPIQRVVVLTSGSAKVAKFGQNGTEVILRLCGPGELVGAFALRKEGLHGSTAQALRISTALAWDVNLFESLSRRFPLLKLNTALVLGRQLNDMEDRFREVSTERVPIRLSRQVIRLMKQVGTPVSEGIEIGISREELAQLIGTSMFTVSRLLSGWDKRGIVRTRREAVVIQNPKALEELSDGIDRMPLKHGNGMAYE
jgi:CRP-like cAMP-binding protein